MVLLSEFSSTAEAVTSTVSGFADREIEIDARDLVDFQHDVAAHLFEARPLAW